jgi:hydroxyacylglutathione hydrolase
MPTTSAAADLARRWKCPTFGRPREVGPLDRRLSRRRALRGAGLDIELTTLDIPGIPRAHRAASAERLLLRRHALRVRAAGALRGHAAQMVDSLAKLARLAPDTRVYCGHEYTLANIRFARRSSPASAGSHSASATTAKRDAGSPPALDDRRGARDQSVLRCGEPRSPPRAPSAGRRLASPVEVFAEIREWKNRF